jgi:pimeloyl-ACP methyl ester carboxylesterase
MALLALELPAHGDRHVAGQEFLDPLAPASLALNVRQAVVDVMAVVHLARRCGIALPDGRRLVPRDVRYLGYSLGGMIGAVARAVEPDLGATALVAPAGDMTSWMMLRIAVSLGSEFVACVGGARNGEDCLHVPCPSPGVCVEQVALSHMKSLIELPYRLVLGGSDPLSFAGQPGGTGSRAPLLIVTGGNDEVLYPLLATRLADAYRLRPTGKGRRHRAGMTLVQWPDFHHNLVTQPEVRNQVYAFLGRGRL